MRAREKAETYFVAECISLQSPLIFQKTLLVDTPPNSDAAIQLNGFADSTDPYEVLHYCLIQKDRSKISEEQSQLHKRIKDQRSANHVLTQHNKTLHCVFFEPHMHRKE
jgi:hypothetical protein